MREVCLSGELERVLDDYRDNRDIEQPLSLCVDLAASLESELSVYRLGDVDRLARTVIEGEVGEVLMRDGGDVVRVDFKMVKERGDE